LKRPDTRWRDDIEKFEGKTWQRIAQIDSCGRSWERPMSSSGLTRFGDDDDDIKFFG